MTRPSAASLFAAGLLLCLAGCSQSSPGGSNAFRVALITPGPISDGGWNASAYEGLQRIATELGADVSNVQAASPADFEQGFRDYAQQGYALVFGHGFEFQDPALRVAREFPSVRFVVSSGSVSAANVASLRFHLEEATYLAGMLAASLSRSGRAGCVGGIELPVIQATFDGFAAGAKSIRPDFVVPTVYTGSFEDVAAARAATDAMVAQGADLVLHNADAAGLGVFQAAKERGILAFGSNRDQSMAAPETVLASAVIAIPEAFLRVATEVKQGSFRGRVIEEGLASGGVSLVGNPRLTDRIPAGVKAKVAQAEEKIRRGELRVKP